MRKPALPATLLLLWFLFLPVASQEQPAHLLVMTFNIRYDNPGDGMYSWKERRAQVFEVIRSEDPAIAGLQEVLAGQLSDLKTALPSYSSIGVGRDDGISKGEFAPILYKASLFAVEKSSTFWLSETPSVAGSISWDAACTRIVTWARMKDLRSGNIHYFFNTHFDHVSEEARMNSARILLDSIRSIAGTHRVILTGDFNCTPSDPAIKNIAGTMTDCHTEAALVTEFPTTFIGFPADTSKREVIDHIFISQNWPRVRKYEVLLYNIDGRYPSDHLPVVSELAVSPQ